MFDTFTVHRRSAGLVASLEADRVAPDFDGGAEGAGAPDGSQPSTDDAHFDDVEGSDGPAAADEGDGRRATAAGDDDEEFDEDDDQSADVNERLKKMQNALKKAKRKLGSSRGDRQMLKELRDAGFRPQDLYADSREYRRLMDLAQRNPRLMGLLNGSDVPEDATARARQPERRARATEDFQFDESPEALGFDPNESRANRTLADGLKRAAKLEHQLTTLLTRLDPDALVQRVDQLDRGFQQQTQAQLNTEWNGAYKAAAAQIKDAGLRTVFSDLMLAAKTTQAGKRPATFFVNHYLKLLNVNPAQASKASAAAAAQTRGRVAERVAQLPRQGQTGGTPAPARKGRESLSDVHKRIKTLNSLGAR